MVFIEVNTVLRAVMVDFFFNCWCLEILSDNRICHVPRCIYYHAQGFRLEMFSNFYVGSGSRIPELYSVSPDSFEFCFMYEKFVPQGIISGFRLCKTLQECLDAIIFVPIEDKYIYMTQVYTCYRNTVFILTLLTLSLHNMFQKCQNKHSVGIAGIDLCHIYIFVIHTQQDATHRNKIPIEELFEFLCCCAK
jgi:hypothetical protein